MQTYKHFRCLGRIEESPNLLQEILSQPALFEADVSRQSHIKVQRETRSIPVRIKQRHQSQPDQKDRDVLGSRWSEWSSHLPILTQFLERIASEQNALLGRVRVVNLPAGQRVYPHIDRGNYYQQHERHHLVLKSTKGSWLKSGDESLRMQEGELWWFDNRVLHEAFNDGDEDRIHVIFDLLPQSKAHLLEPSASIAGHSSVMTGQSGIFCLPAGIHALELPGCLPLTVIVPSAVQDATPLVSIHGMQRDVQVQIDALAVRAEQTGRLVLLPLFAASAFPKYRMARCTQQADAALLRTLRGLREHAGLDTQQIDLSGFSAGAQFAHRFAMLYPNRIRRLVLSSSGWYTWPDAERQHAFPYGLGGMDLAAHVMHRNLGSYLSLPITIVVGQADCVIDGTTRQSELLEQLQGTQRLERAHRYAEALKRAAQGFSTNSQFVLLTLPDAGHRFDECAKAGLLDALLPASAANTSPMNADSQQSHAA